MASDFMDVVDGMSDDKLLTTGEAARLLGVSRQHIVDLIDRGDLAATWIGSHRRVLRRDLPDVTDPRRATRDQRRTRWLGVATAGQVVRDPVAARKAARAFLTAHRTRRNQWTDEWSRLIEGPVDGIVDALTGTSVRARELRQNSPFAALISPESRAEVLTAFHAEG